MTSTSSFALDKRAVVGSIDPDTNMPFDMSIFFGGSNIRYDMNNLNDEFNFTIYHHDHQSAEVITIHLGHIIQRAIQSWTSSISGIRFQNMTGLNIQERGIIFAIEDTRDERFRDAIARTEVLDDLGLVTIYLNRLIIQSNLSIYYEQAISENAISSNTSLQNYLEMNLYETLIHEIGHALGLGHPIANDTEEGQWRVIVEPSSFSHRPSIMLSGDNEELLYPQSMANYLGRPITISDVGPTTNDLLGVRVMFNSNINLIDRRSVLQSLVSLCLGSTIASGRYRRDTTNVNYSVNYDNKTCDNVRAFISRSILLIVF